VIDYATPALFLREEAADISIVSGMKETPTS
jgi:hypothetical protein